VKIIGRTTRNPWDLILSTSDAGSGSRGSSDIDSGSRCGCSRRNSTSGDSGSVSGSSSGSESSGIAEISTYEDVVRVARELGVPLDFT
jgi:hypothetical protein